MVATLTGFLSVTTNLDKITRSELLTLGPDGSYVA